MLEIAFVSLNWATSASLSILMPKRHLHLTTGFMIHFCVLFLFSFSLKMFRIKKLCRMCVLHTIPTWQSTLRNCYVELEGVFTSSNKLSYFTMIQSSDTRNRPRNGRKNKWKKSAQIRNIDRKSYHFPSFEEYGMVHDKCHWNDNDERWITVALEIKIVLVTMAIFS